MEDGGLTYALSCIRRHDLELKGYFKEETLFKYASGTYYKTYSIPKKSGGKRIISVPDRELKLIQICIKILLSRKYTPNKNVFGFIEHRSIVDNAKVHLNQDVVYSIDLKDFFPSIHKNLIIEKLVRRYLMNYPMAKLIASLVTMRNNEGNYILPQGAPSSPIVTNMMCEHLDLRLSSFANIHHINYSRYADDISLSFSYKFYHYWNHPHFSFRKHRYAGINYDAKTMIEKIIETEGFRINTKKTHISFSGQKQQVTGLIVNRKVNVPRVFVKRLRTIIHNWEIDGYAKAYNIFLMCYIRQKRGNIKGEIRMERVIEGKLSYLKMVKGTEDSTYRSLLQRYNQLLIRDKQFIN